MSFKAQPAAGSSRAAVLRELLRFFIVGVLNTASGYAIFWVLLKLLGLSPQWANAVTYAISLCIAFVMTRNFVFRASAVSARNTVWRYLLAFGAAFAVNQAVLWLLLRTGLRAEFAQLGAMVSYTIVFFILNKLFVFQPTPAAT